MIIYRELTMDDAEKLVEIDRSEHIDFTYELRNGEVVEVPAGHQCPNWDVDQVRELINRYKLELGLGGKAFGAFDNGVLAGFAVLGHKFRGKKTDQLQVDLMYVSRTYRRQGIGTRLLEEIGQEARRRGAASLYISSTETASAVGFYRSNGSELADDIDEELFRLEPLDIHMIKKL
ncbi:GNAT family N-acetyltransferase [Paenibacillus sambharensis]|uniref:GNAT family N-acetyltransferase n=1 Tax=Paenibacillus sambharensis TaxID=1803190 RepID=A0A2W1LRZ8_9BACL|nr:GNAT family N-acetyltransferase [Paenibacillus sambharensis]PZD97264.1 GNAT family N-acetyltransferase [Paenibacillus sambharensis]